MDWSHLRAVALDFDGTLLDHGGVIHPATRAAIARAAAAGIRVCTASGRPPQSQREILDQHDLGVETRLISALCCDESSVWLLDGDDYAPYRAWNDPIAATFERLLPLAQELLDEAFRRLPELGLPCRHHIGPEGFRERGQVDFRCEHEAAAIRAAAWLRERVAATTSELQVTQNWHIVILVPAVAGKGNSVAAMARALGLQPGQMLAVGDRDNDTTMLNGSAGLAAAAVGNAVPEIAALVRGQGGYVAQAEQGAGVAEILDRLVAAQR